MRESLEPRDSAPHEVGSEASPVHDAAERDPRARSGSLHVHSVVIGKSGVGRLHIIALAIAAVVIGGAFLALGLLLIAALVVTGVLAGGGYLLWRRVRRALHGTGTRTPRNLLELDPALEIQGEVRHPDSATSHEPRSGSR